MAALINKITDSGFLFLFFLILGCTYCQSLYYSLEILSFIFSYSFGIPEPFWNSIPAYTTAVSLCFLNSLSAFSLVPTIYSQQSSQCDYVNTEVRSYFKISLLKFLSLLSC